MNPIRLLTRHWRLLLVTAFNEVQARYASTALGLGWAVVYPFLFLGFYAVIYTLVFKVRLPGGTTGDYVLMMFSGLVPFIGFSEALSTGTGCVVANKGLVRNTLFPIDLVPPRQVLSSSVTMVVGLAGLMAGLWIHGTVYTTQLALPLILLLQLSFTTGVVWLLSAVTVFLRDLGQVVSVVVLFLMVVSPIAYTADMVPAELRPFMFLNPLYFLIGLYRGALVTGHLDGQVLGVFAVFSAISFFGGHWIFARLRPLFADHV